MKVICHGCGDKLRTKHTILHALASHSHFYGELMNHRMRGALGLQCKNCGGHHIGKVRKREIIGIK